MTQLVTIEQKNAMEVFTADKGLDPYLEKIQKEVSTLVPDLSTQKGRKEIASMAQKVAKSKTYLDGVGKDLVAEMKKKPKLIDAERKRMREFLDKLKEEVRQPLTDWEAKEEARKNAIHVRINGISALANVEGKPADFIREQISILEDECEIDDWFAEFQEYAQQTKDKALVSLYQQLEARVKFEEEQEELKKLRELKAEQEKMEQERLEKERQEALKREAQERAVREAEEKIKAEKEAARQRELKLQQEKEAAERAQKEAEEREQKAKAEAEQRAIRLAEEKKQREEEEAKQREADKNHRKTINNQAANGFAAKGFSVEDSKKIVQLLARKEIPHCSINY